MFTILEFIAEQTYGDASWYFYILPVIIDVAIIDRIINHR